MLATIQLPNNSKEIAFILEVLKRLNVEVITDISTLPIDDQVLEEHAAILRERRASMNSVDAQFFTWEEAQQVLAKRKD